jgi:class 3 adenylate cyclase
MLKLRDVFRDDQSIVTKATLAVDIAGSAETKRTTSEADWLNTFAWLFDQLEETIGAFGGVIVKYLGDGVMAVFDKGKAANAINWAIRVQEIVDDARTAGRVYCDVSIGIAYGTMREFATPLGARDYIGTTVDRAFRLCSAANARGIFVDTKTVQSAAMDEVESRYGKVHHWEADEYQGTQQEVPAKGFSQPIPYHEIQWHNATYGVRPDHVTEAAKPQPPRQSQPVLPPVQPPGSTVQRPDRPPVPPPPAPGFPDPIRPRAKDWRYGTVTRTGPYGFIRTPDGFDYFFRSTSYLHQDKPAALQATVAFIPAPPEIDGKQPRALTIVPFETQLAGILEVVNPAGFGFVSTISDRGEYRQFWIYLGGPSNAANWPQGGSIEFTVGLGREGVVALNPRLIEHVGPRPLRPYKDVSEGESAEGEEIKSG